MLPFPVGGSEEGGAKPHKYGVVVFIVGPVPAAVGVIPTAAADGYQLAFLTPGIKPAEAISRNCIREIPNWRI